MSSIIPYGRQSITEEDIDAVIEVLKSDYLTQGPRIKEFEEKFSNYVGSKYAIAVSNGTAALHLSAMALGVSKGDKIITTPITFAASGNCISYCGGEVVFSDIEPETYLLDSSKVRELLESSPKGTFKGIIPVSFAGRAVDLEKYRALADEFGLWILEDACHSPGGHFLDTDGLIQACGNGHFADVSIFSFHPVKHIAAGEGGMITTNNQALYEKLLSLRTHGITRDSLVFQNSIELAVGESTDNKSDWPGWYMEMQELGYNYRLTDFQAALGSSQLLRAGDGIRRRQAIAKEYHSAFKSIPQIIDRNIEAGVGRELPNGHAYHLYVIEVEDRYGLYNFMRSHGVYLQVHYIPMHLMPYYRGLGWGVGDFPKAENYYKKCLSLPMFPTLKGEEQLKVISLIKEYYKK